jgi:hypothetical protein
VLHRLAALHSLLDTLAAALFSPHGLDHARIFPGCVLGSAVQLALEIAQNRPSFGDVGVALFDAFLILVIFFGLDSFFRWQMGPPKNTE